MRVNKRTLLTVLGIIVIVVLVGGGFLILGNADGATRENIIALAADYLEQGEYDRALDLLEGILIQNPQDEEATALRNRILQQKQGVELLQNNSGDSATDILAAQQAASASRLAEAELDRQTAEIQLQQRLADQRSAEERRRQEEEAKRLRDEEKRLSALTAAEAARQRQINGLLLEARQLQDDQQFVAARGKINRAINLDTEAALPYARLSESYVEEDIRNDDNIAHALEFAEIAIEKDPKLWEPYYTQGRIFNATRQYDRAVKELSTAAELNGTNAAIFYALGNAQFDAGLFSAARGSYETSIFLDSRNERAFFNLGLTFERLNLDSSAMTNYQKAVAVAGDYAAAYNRLGEILLEKGEFDNALSYLLQAISHDNNARNNRSLARAFYEQGEYTQALDFFLITVKLEPRRAQNHYNIATVLLDMDRPEEALPYAAEALTLNASIPEYHYTLGLALKASNSLEEAKAYFRRAVEQKNNYLKPRIELSDIFIIDENYEAALKELLTAYRIDARRSDVNNNLATVYRLMGLHEDSLKHSSAAVSAEPGSALIRYNLSLTLIKLEQFTQAESSLRTTISIDGNYWDAYLRLGEVLLAQNKQNEAKKILNRLLTKAAGSTQAQEAQQLMNSL